jgi:hypothetical protein
LGAGRAVGPRRRVCTWGAVLRSVSRLLPVGCLRSGSGLRSGPVAVWSGNPMLSIPWHPGGPGTALRTRLNSPGAWFTGQRGTGQRGTGQRSTGNRGRPHARTAEWIRSRDRARSSRVRTGSGGSGRVRGGSGRSRGRRSGRGLAVSTSGPGRRVRCAGRTVEAVRVPRDPSPVRQPVLASGHEVGVSRQAAARVAIEPVAVQAAVLARLARTGVAVGDDARAQVRNEMTGRSHRLASGLAAPRPVRVLGLLGLLG